MCGHQLGWYNDEKSTNSVQRVVSRTLVLSRCVSVKCRMEALASFDKNVLFELCYLLNFTTEWLEGGWCRGSRDQLCANSLTPLWEVTLTLNAQVFFHPDTENHSSYCTSLLYSGVLYNYSLSYALEWQGVVFVFVFCFVILFFCLGGGAIRC